MIQSSLNSSKEVTDPQYIMPQVSTVEGNAISTLDNGLDNELSFNQTNDHDSIFEESGYKIPPEPIEKPTIKPARLKPKITKKNEQK